MHVSTRHARTSTSPIIQGHIYLQERKVNRVAAAALNIVVGRGVCGAAVEVDPGPRRTQQVMT